MRVYRTARAARLALRAKCCLSGAMKSWLDNLATGRKELCRTREVETVEHIAERDVVASTSRHSADVIVHAASYKELGLPQPTDQRVGAANCYGGQAHRVGRRLIFRLRVAMASSRCPPNADHQKLPPTAATRVEDRAEAHRDIGDRLRDFRCKLIGTRTRGRPIFFSGFRKANGRCDKARAFVLLKILRCVSSGTVRPGAYHFRPAPTWRFASSTTRWLRMQLPAYPTRGTDLGRCRPRSVGPDRTFADLAPQFLRWVRRLRVPGSTTAVVSRRLQIWLTRSARDDVFRTESPLEAVSHWGCGC